jgi:inorganic triphosphatase YgiF
MEIESKYKASKLQFDKLLMVKSLGQYDLVNSEEHFITDRYIDTAEHSILKNGYACRIREQNGRWILTVKGLGVVKGAIHHREEYETEIDPHKPPGEWSPSPARDMVLSFSKPNPLIELFVIRQHRSNRIIKQGERCVGILSLDKVDMEIPGHDEKIYEVEVELTRDGSLSDLEILDGIFRSEGLKPEPRSKFKRAMAYLK